MLRICWYIKVDNFVFNRFLNYDYCINTIIFVVEILFKKKKKKSQQINPQIKIPEYTPAHKIPWKSHKPVVWLLCEFGLWSVSLCTFLTIINRFGWLQCSSLLYQLVFWSCRCSLYQLVGVWSLDCQIGLRQPKSFIQPKVC